MRSRQGNVRQIENTHIHLQKVTLSESSCYALHCRRLTCSVSSHLQLTLPREGAGFEDIQDERSSVTKPHTISKELGQIPKLAWRQLTVHNDRVCSCRLKLCDKLQDLARPQESIAIWRVQMLLEQPNYLQAFVPSVCPDVCLCIIVTST